MRIDMRVVVALVLTLVVVNIVTSYAVREPSRQAEAAQRQERESTERGASLFSSLCVGCHGKDGKGLVGPSVVRADYLGRHKFADGDADSMKKAATLMSKTIARGRANTPMPAWSDEEGGSLNREQILEVTTFLLYGGPEDWSQVEKHSPEAPGFAAPPANNAPGRGKEIFAAKGCSACHGPNAEGVVGPALAGFKASQIKAQVRKPKGAMPEFSQERLNDDELEAIIAFGESLSLTKN